MHFRHPVMAEDVHPPSVFALASLQNLSVLELQGEFERVSLENLPVLSRLEMQYNWSRVYLEAWKGSTLKLGSLTAKGDSDNRIFKGIQMNIDWKAVKSA